VPYAKDLPSFVTVQNSHRKTDVTDLFGQLVLSRKDCGYIISRNIKQTLGDNWSQAKQTDLGACVCDHVKCWKKMSRWALLYLLECKTRFSS
jgi:hypothetical protein